MLKRAEILAQILEQLDPVVRPEDTILGSIPWINCAARVFGLSAQIVNL